MKATGTGRVAITCSNDTNVCQNAQLNCGVNSCEATCTGNSKPTLNGCGNMPSNPCQCKSC